MTDQHPITPPPELLQQWATEYWDNSGESVQGEKYIATQAVRWGADQELEACCKLLELTDSNVREFLHSARRPKPPSLAEEALDAAKDMSDCMSHGFVPKRSNLDTIRAALERLKELEGTND